MIGPLSVYQHGREHIKTPQLSVDIQGGSSVEASLMLAGWCMYCIKFGNTPQKFTHLSHTEQRNLSNASKPLASTISAFANG